MEVQKGFLAFNEKSNKKCCPVQGGLGFPVSFMWHREATRANLVLKSKELSIFDNRRMSLEAHEAQPSHTRLGFGTGSLQEGLICN